MKQVLLQNGKPIVEEVPAPCAEPGFVVVRVRFSAISSGTERSSLSAAAEPLWKKALRHPEKALKAIQMVRTEGVARTIDTIQGKLAAPQTVGYSAAGVVTEGGAAIGAQVGNSVARFRPGDRVACAGAGYANHAEVIRVPVNLVVPIPPAVDFAAASTVALGGIALQGLRRAGPTLGERFLVLGLGLLGQLTVQMLRAAGCRTIGYDPQPDRVCLAETLGLENAIDAAEGDIPAAVARLTGGLGVDGVIVTASTPSSDVLSIGLRATRRKGRVVIVGDVGLDLKRADIYPGEKDLFISTSYGPGRYDPEYEEKGRDYPLAFVRWTENRNMEEYLRLLAAAAVRVEPLVGASVPVVEAERAYELLSAPPESGKPRPLLVLLSYPERAADALAELSPRKVVHIRGPARQVAGLIRTAIVGAGSFATSVHLPNLTRLRESFSIQSVMSRSGVSAVAAAKRFGANSSTTDVAAVLGDPEVDLVVISTRHNLHAELAARALDAGKHVFLEKPLATDRAGLDRLLEACERAQNASAGLPLFFVGFNRRFSPYLDRVKKLIAGRQGPLVVHYRVNAGSLPANHWVHGEEGGGRNIGEACHFYDVFTFLTGQRVASIDAVAAGAGAAGTLRANENFSASISFVDGSLCTLLYTASGSSALGKERMELFVDGKALVLDDFLRLELHGFAGEGFSTRGPEKGHLEELEALARALRSAPCEERKWPIPLEDLVQSAEIAFAVEERLHSGRREG